MYTSAIFQSTRREIRSELHGSKSKVTWQKAIRARLSYIERLNISISQMMQGHSCS